VLGLREGSPEATRAVSSLLAKLIDRGLDADWMPPRVIDGGKALRKAIVQIFGATSLIQRCPEHKRRNVNTGLHAVQRVGRPLRHRVEHIAQQAEHDLLLVDLVCEQRRQRRHWPAARVQAECTTGGSGRTRSAQSTPPTSIAMPAAAAGSGQRPRSVKA
jgi:hypothetical protein